MTKTNTSPPNKAPNAETVLALNLRVRPLSMPLVLETAASSIVLTGPSGVGKTTLLRAIAGVLSARAVTGSLVIQGEVWLDAHSRLEPETRKAALVPQSSAIFPHLSVRDNLAFARLEHAESIEEVAEWLEISALLGRRSQGLSGGEQQRVALGRAWLSGPRLLLLDESFNAMDRPMRERIQERLFLRTNQAGVPRICVTHNPASLLSSEHAEHWELTSTGLSLSAT